VTRTAAGDMGRESTVRGHSGPVNTAIGNTAAGGAADPPLVNLNEIAEIELFVLRRMKELTMGDHASVYKGLGFRFVGTRDWEPGDRTSSVDWAQSSMNNFSPLIIREFEQDSNAAVVAVADASLSTRCGVGGTLIATAIARSVAAVGLSAVLFQDMFGLVTFDDRFEQRAVARPRIGRSHVIYCLDLYQQRATVEAPGGVRDTIMAIESQLRRAALVPVISDFLFPDVARVIKELSLLNAVHDVFLLMADVRFAYALPDVSDGWLEAFDVETGRTRMFSRRELRRLVARVEEWQNDVVALARDADLDIVRVGLDRWEMETVLVQFTAERRLRKL
jgi:uncharacterized protein (DUF58 family)